MAKVEDIPFRNIPHQSSIFLSYIDLAPGALRFYRGAPTLQNLVQTAKGIAASYQVPRAEIASILRRQNEAFGIGRETARSIDSLENPDWIPIISVTGSGGIMSATDPGAASLPQRFYLVRLVVPQ